MTAAATIRSPRPPADIPIRIGDAADRGFIVDGWRKSFRSAPGYEHASDGDYYPAMGARIDKLLEDSEFLIATDPKSNDDVGFVVFDGPTLHYIYVVYKIQGYGIGRALLDAANRVEPLTTFTHWSKPLRNPMMGIFRGLKYNPFRGIT